MRRELRYEVVLRGEIVGMDDQMRAALDRMIQRGVHDLGEGTLGYAALITGINRTEVEVISIQKRRENDRDIDIDDGC